MIKQLFWESLKGGYSKVTANSYGQTDIVDTTQLTFVTGIHSLSKEQIPSGC